MGMKLACGRLLYGRSKLHYGECGEQTAGWCGVKLQAIRRGSSSGVSQASMLYAMARARLSVSWVNWWCVRWVNTKQCSSPDW